MSTTDPLPTPLPTTTLPPLQIGEGVFAITGRSDLRKLRASYTTYSYLEPTEVLGLIKKVDEVPALRKSDGQLLWISRACIGHIASERKYDKYTTLPQSTIICGYEVCWNMKGVSNFSPTVFQDESMLVSMSDLVILDPAELKEYVLHGKKPG